MSANLVAKDTTPRAASLGDGARALPFVADVERVGDRMFVVVVSILPGTERARADVAELGRDGRLVRLDWRAGHDRRGVEYAAEMAVHAAVRVIARLAGEPRAASEAPVRSLGPGGVRRWSHRCLARCGEHPPAA